MVGNEEKMRMWGGWKGFPLPAAHWTAMTTFSPEAPSSLHPAPLFALVIPPSICVHLPLLINSRFPHHNRSFSFSVSYLDAERKSSALIFGFVLFIFFSSPLPPKDTFLELLVNFLHLYLLLLHLCLPPLWVGRCCVSPSTLPLCMTQNSATEPPMLVAFSITKTEKKSCRGRQGHRNKKHCDVFPGFASPHLLTQTIDPDTTTSFSIFQTELFCYCEEGVTDWLADCLHPAGAPCMSPWFWGFHHVKQSVRSVLIWRCSLFNFIVDACLGSGSAGSACT